MKDIVKKNIFGINLTDITERGVLEYIWLSLEKKSDPYYIVTPNPEMVVASQKHKEYADYLNNAQLSVCDGIGLFLAAKFLGSGVKQRITGVDLLENICKESVRKPVNIGFLGGRGSVAQKAAECLERKHGKLNIVFIGEEWGEVGFDLAAERRTNRNKTQNDAENGVSVVPRIVSRDSATIDILFVAFGFPKQEKWMAENVGKLPFRVAIGVGGAFDYFSGEVKRSPKIFRTLGLEWLHRLVVQPWRWRRQLALVKFAWLVCKERF